jgi:ribosomal RNA-processing protein 8
MKDETKYELWTQFLEEYKEYFISNDDKWFNIFEELKDFIDANKKRPNAYSKNPAEKKLGLWTYTQNTNYKKEVQAMKDEKIYKSWSQFLEEYKEYFISDNDKWFNTFEELKDFIDTNKKRPNTHSTNLSEKKLGKWTSTQNKNYKKEVQAMKDEKIYKSWTQFLEEYEEYFISDNDKWFNTFEELKDFINANKKRPSDKSINPSEKKLAVWTSTQTQNYKKKLKSMKDEKIYKSWTQFLEEYEEYFISDNDIWFNTFEELKNFIDTNKKRPSPVSKNPTEKKLARWLSLQNKNYKKEVQAMKDKTKYESWTQFLEEYKEYVKTNDDIWNISFEVLKNFINTNKKRPSEKSKNPTEKKLGQWLSHQIQNYKKNVQAMKDETKRESWSQFLEEYKEYFDNSDTQSVASTETLPSIKDGESQVSEPKSTSKKSKSNNKLIIEKDSDDEEYKFKHKMKSMKLTKPSTKSKQEETQQQKTERVKSQLSTLNQKYKTRSSENLHREFNENPEEWHRYHEISEENEKTFPEDEIPRNRIITELNKINTKRTKSVIDMGCGKAQIADYFRNDKRFKFTNFDHISINDTITPCDISKLPLEDDTVEIAILSLAMWGTNCEEYVKEANRVLETGGKLYIIEPTKRWSKKDETKNVIEGTEGLRLKELLEECGFQIVKQSIEKFCLFHCVKI